MYWPGLNQDLKHRCDKQCRPFVNCFSKCGFDEATLELFIDDDADAELVEL